MEYLKNHIFNRNLDQGAPTLQDWDRMKFSYGLL